MERPLDAIDACRDLTDEQLRGEIARRDRERHEAQYKSWQEILGPCQECGNTGIKEITNTMIERYTQMKAGRRAYAFVPPNEWDTETIGGLYENSVTYECGHTRTWREPRFFERKDAPNCENGGTTCRDCPGCANPALGCAC